MEKLYTIDVWKFGAVFWPGGYGPPGDPAESQISKAIKEDALALDQPVALVCHAPAVLRNVTAPGDDPIVKGHKVTGVTNQEEDAVGLTGVVPLLLEDILIEQGGIFSKRGVLEPCLLQDGMLITGQNPPASEPAAKKLWEVLKGE